MLIENQLKKLGFGVAALFLLIVAMLLGIVQMYLMALIVAMVPVVGWILNRVMMRGLVCERSAPQTADEFGRAQITVTVRNRGISPKFYLRIMDSLPRYMRYAGSSQDDSAFIKELWPGETARVKYIVEPQKRGLHRVGPLTVTATDVFGFSAMSATVPGQSDILVYPEILPVSSNLLSSGAATGWRDEANARSRGDGTDFTGVREYRPGDELRRINWKTTARTGSLVVTEYAQGYASDLTIVLDRQASAYADSGIGVVSAFEYGVKIATTIGATALRDGSVVRLIASASSAADADELREWSEISVLLDRMARVEPDGDADLADQLAAVSGSTKPGSILVVITPRSSDDQALQEELDCWRRTPILASIHLFRLDNASFRDARTGTRLGRPVLSSGDSRTLSQVIRTQLGREYTVSATTNLVALLGESRID
jgi:uncharacterized protein (DUF58 family)